MCAVFFLGGVYWNVRCLGGAGASCSGDMKNKPATSYLLLLLLSLNLSRGLRLVEAAVKES